MVFALTIFDRQIIDACDPTSHQTFRVELPILISIAAEPAAGIIVPFIGKAYGDPVFTERPHFLDQTIIELAIPFARKERHDFLAAMNEFGAVAPDAVGRVGLGNAGGLARIPSILGEPRLLRRGFGTKGRHGWTAHELTLSRSIRQNGDAAGRARLLSSSNWSLMAIPLTLGERRAQNAHTNRGIHC